MKEFMENSRANRWRILGAKMQINFLHGLSGKRRTKRNCKNAQNPTYKQASMVFGFWLEKQTKAAKFWKNFSSTNPTTQVSGKARKNLKTKGVFMLEYSDTHQDINQGVGIFFRAILGVAAECVRGSKTRRKSGIFRGVFELTCSGFNWCFEQEKLCKDWCTISSPKTGNHKVNG